MNNESFCLPGDWNFGCMDNMSDSEANFLFFGNDDGFVSTAKRPNGRNVKVWVHFKGGVPVIRLQWKGGWSEYRPAIDGNGLIKIIYDRYFDEKKESRSNIKDALFHVPNSNDLWNRVKTAMDEYVLYKNNMKTNKNKNMNKKDTIRMNEAQLKRVVAGVVKNILNEYYDKERWSQAEGGYIPNDDEEDFGTAGDNSLLNEISLTDKYDIEKKNGKTNLDYHTYILICRLDPTVRHHYYAGKYCNWLLQKFDISKIRDREYKRSIRVALEQYNDGVKRGILKRHGISSDIGSFKSVEDLVSTMSNIMGGGTQMSQSASNHMDRLKGQYEIVGESENWMIVCPKTFEAERYFGSGTEWCTVANEEYFNSYRKRGDLYITVPKNMDNELKMQFHFNSQSFADFEDCVYGNPKVCIFNVLGDGKEFNEVYEMWSKRSMVFDELYKFVKMSDVEGLLESGKDPYDIFDGVGYDDNGVRKVILNNKYNLIDNKNRLLSPNMWFDGCGNLQPNACIMVRVKHLYNFLDVRTKKLLYDKPVEEWFYDVGDFFNGFALVAIRSSDNIVKYNFINGNGEFLWKKPYEEWFDFVTGFHNGYGRAQFQDVWYKIDTNGNLHDNVTNEKIR